MIVDLRDYTLVPAARDRFIERCEDLLFPEQERLGAGFLGLFRDAGDPARFVWLRGMPDLATRQRVLTAFYSEGALWKAHRDQVNAELVDSDDVLLVRPLGALARPAVGASEVGMYTHLERAPLTPAAGTRLQQEVEAAVTGAGGRLLATFATDPAENNYPRHPIRAGEHGRVWFATFEGSPRLALGSVVQRHLLPTPRSRLR